MAESGLQAPVAILVIWSDLRAREMLVAHLASRGFTVMTASDAAEAEVVLECCRVAAIVFGGDVREHAIDALVARHHDAESTLPALVVLEPALVAESRSTRLPVLRAPAPLVAASMLEELFRRARA
jgi:hypothetical protein